MDKDFIKRMEGIARAAGEGLTTKAEVAQVLKMLVDTFSELFSGVGKQVDDIDAAYKAADKKLDERIDGVETVHENDIAAVRAEIKTIALTPGDPGKDSDPEDVKRRVLAEIEVPAPIPGSPDTAGQVRDKLETLKGDERLDAKAISGLEDVIRQLLPKRDNGVRVIGGRAGIQMYIDGAKVGLVQYLNLLAGSGITFDYLNKNGVLTLTVNSTGGTPAQWYLGEQITLDVDAMTFHLLHAPTAKLEVLLDRQPQIMGLDITGTIDGANKDFAFTSPVDSSLLADIYANYL